MKTRSEGRCALALGVAGVLYFTICVTPTVRAQISTEYVIPTGNSLPGSITLGPDGALWFTEVNAEKIGRVTVSGAFTEYPLTARPLDITGGADGGVWFLESNVVTSSDKIGFGTFAYKIGRIGTNGSITEFPVSTPSRITDGSVGAIAAGPDGALWFTLGALGILGRITTTGSITEFSSAGGPGAITAGPDGALWFTDGVNNAIGHLTTSGGINEYLIPTGGTAPGFITIGPDGALWFTESNKIGRITTSGSISEFSIPTTNSDPSGIVTGPDGALWFTEQNLNQIGRITTSGSVTEYPTPFVQLFPPIAIALGPDGALWYTDHANQIVRLVPAPATPPLYAAVLPSSRSVEVGNTATAFATIINTGGAASGCAIVPVTPVPASFVYQTTDPATNAPTGSPNMPVSIGAGASQSFVIALTPSAPFVPTTLALGFDCTGVDAAPSNTGLNTVLLSASGTPVPDIVALAATARNDGILHIIGTTGSNAFAVATVNVGASAAITATVNTGAVSLLLAISLCQTDPTSGQCISSIGPSVTTTINANATPTFAIFATASGTGAVRAADQPHHRRVHRRQRNRARLDQRRRRDAMNRKVGLNGCHVPS
jgi:streptogramin lyase